MVTDSINASNNKKDVEMQNTRSRKWKIRQQLGS